MARCPKAIFGGVKLGFFVFLFENGNFLDEFGDFGLLFAEADGEEEANNNKKPNDNEKKEIGESFETEPVGKMSNRVGENSNDDENNREK